MKEKVQDILLILLGGSIMGFALDFFLVPSQVTAGGVSGVSTVLYYLFNLPIGLMVLVLNIPIFILGFITFNSRFLITSLIGTVALSVSAQFFELEIFLNSPYADFLEMLILGFLKYLIYRTL